MSILNRLHLSSSSRLPVLLQTEATECGLACLGMIAAHHGYHSDLASLRSRFPVSQKGSTLLHLIQIAEQMQLASRPLKLDLDELGDLRLPCILHWNLQHFVVLKSVRKNTAVIHDPAFGVRKLSLAEVSNSFTGIALELWPNADFKQQEVKQHISLRAMMGRITGLKGALTQILLLAFGLELFSLISPLYMQWILDNVLVTADTNLLTTLAVGFGLLVLVQQTISTLRSWMLIYLGTTLSIQWRSNVFTHLIRLPVQYFEKRHLGDVVSRFESVGTIQGTLTSSFLEGILDGVMAILTLTMMFIYSTTLPWVSLSAMLLYTVGRWLWYAPLRNATEAQLVHAAKQQSHFLESMRGVKTIKLFQNQDARRASWLTLLINQINADLRTQKLQLAYKAMNGVLFGLERVLLIWLGASLVIDGNFTAGVLIAFISYREQFNGRVSSLIDKFFELRMLRLHGERLADIVFSEPENLTGKNLSGERLTLQPSIAIRDLAFRYAEQEPLVLDGITVSIAAGESVAIVGPSGCGKSTLVNIMLGILPPTRGEVLIGDMELSKIGLAGLRDMVGTVMQDDVLFSGSIADNISFFSPTADPEWIAQCAVMAAIHDEIMMMPMGYNTLTGDMGTVLSGGQKQRIILARALYKRPKILILDEATSHLDIAREHQVNHAVNHLSITRIIVAHRPETIASASRVIVLENGKVAADQQLPVKPER
ncbi:peptidase domain-containing ABC transporter [Herbaspirillum autotrophicum]|uniref:peptidase domain-containing ABC transporter n=1 Tax=Herbaspirillum autotrophicum TaxID=180195 RepID=UPI00067D39FC|nr:peptidase domain-containing ABC transporter [Herbaspirillum autotrophicum]